MSFGRYLRHVEKGLEVPYPQRKELLDEIAAHLEELFEEKLKAGFSEGEAKREALRAMALDEEFVGEIDEVHAPLVRRALATLPPPLSLVIEHFGVGFLAALVLIAIIVREDAMLQFFKEMGFFMYLLNFIGLAIVFLVGERTVSLFFKKDHSEENLGRRLLSLKFLGLASVMVGAIATLLGYFQAFSSASRIAAKYGGEFPIWKVSRIAISPSIWGLTLALVALFGWYAFRAKGERIQAMRLEEKPK